MSSESSNQNSSDDDHHNGDISFSREKVSLFADLQNLQPYSFEPLPSSSEDEKVTLDEGNSERLGNTTRCTCKICKAINKYKKIKKDIFYIVIIFIQSLNEEVLNKHFIYNKPSLPWFTYFDFLFGTYLAE